MKQKLIDLANLLSESSPSAADSILKLAGRFDKSKSSIPIKSQSAYKYLMYLKFYKNINNRLFHKLKRNYLDSTPSLQKECHDELQKLISRDAAKQKIPSSTIRKNFKAHLSQFESDIELWNSYFDTKLGKRSD